jgi:hypothetical protein
MSGSDLSKSRRQLGSPTTKAPRSTSLDRWGILNPWGDVWTVETFDDADRARDHVRAFWAGQQQDLTKFSVVPVRVRVSVPFELRGKASPYRGEKLPQPPDAAAPDSQSPSSAQPLLGEPSHDR